jgi:hypothetical protein
LQVVQVIYTDRDSKNRKKRMEIEMDIVADRVYAVILKKKNFFFFSVVVEEIEIVVVVML